MIENWLGVICPLAGFENSKGGLGTMFNFISSNGARTEQRDKIPQYTTYMIPRNKQIRSIGIYYIDGYWIHGFMFFDHNDFPIGKIGLIESHMSIKKVHIAENEVILGVVATLATGW